MHRRKCCVIFSRRVVKILINKKSAIWRIFYFLDDQNNAHNHPIPVHRNSQLPKRTRIISFLLRPFWRASHAGARMIANTIAIDAMYFITSKKSNVMFIYLYAIFCGVAQFFFDTQQLVIFCHAVRAGH